MATIRAHASYENALRAAEAMGIDITLPSPTDQPQTVEEFKEWQDQLFSSLPPPKIPVPKFNCVAMHDVPTAETAANTEELDNVCGICHGVLVGNTETRLAPVKLMACNHALHQECLEHFFHVSSTSKCPYCRKEVLDVEVDPAWWLEDLLEALDEDSPIEQQSREDVLNDAILYWWDDGMSAEASHLYPDGEASDTEED